MASNELESDMKKCSKCDYYFPSEDFNEHQDNCDLRVECDKCKCDYQLTELEKHLKDCRGFEDRVCFIAEYSRKKYSYTTIRYLLKSLEKKGESNNMTGRDVLKIVNAEDFDVGDWIDTENATLMECPLCSYELPLDDIFVLSCNFDHKICYNCLYQHSLRNLIIHTPLSCPIGDCEELIHINELKSLPFPRYMVRKLVEKYEKELLKKFTETTTGAIRCPNKACNWVAILEIKDRYNVKCMKCSTDFCTKCRKASHYRVECNEIPKYTQNWMIWCDIGREARKKELKSPDAAVQAYKKARNEVKKFNDNLKRNFAQLKKDEEYKVSRCRYCPMCERIVEKLEGCDYMVCGEDFHGDEYEERKDIQNGCGEMFDWSIAKPYETQIGNQPLLEKLALDAPQQVMENYSHFPYKCDNCNNDIVGIRFECMHCECINFCEDCEQNVTLNHPEGHVFKLIFKKKSVVSGKNPCKVQ